MTSYDDALRALAASEGIEYVDCRVQPGWENDIPRLRVVESLPTHKKGVTPSGEGASPKTRPVTPEPPILLRSSFEQLVLDPRYREAADRGLKIHEAALARAEAEGISYEEALKEEMP